MSATKCVFVISLLSIFSTTVDAAVIEPEIVAAGALGDLVFAHVLYRHGDRNPTKQGPGDEYDISYWPGGWSQLTNLGKQQQYDLGKWFRRRYQDFISTAFNVDDIYVQSSDVDRTLMSAEANLAGFYSSIDETQIWNDNLPWEPIPIHTMPVDTDPLIASGVPTTCTSYHKARNEYLVSAEINEFDESVQPFYDYLTLSTRTTVNTPKALMLLRDSWLCQSIHNLSLPEWTKPLYPNNDEFEKAAMKYFYLSSATKFLAKFSSGFLLKDILDRFTSKIKKTLSPDRKLFMYSSHDSTLSSFLNSLDIFDNKFVPYAAAIILELRLYRSQHYVQIFYKNSDETPYPLRIPGCGNACPLWRMYDVYDDILPKNDFYTECEIDE